MDTAHLNLAFDECEHGGVRLSVVSVGELVIRSGAVAACDPIVFIGGVEALAVSLPPGRYPVLLSIAHFDNDDQRVAFARIAAGDGVPVTWEMVTTGSFDMDLLGPEEIVGYPVDSGTGCFADREAFGALGQAIDADPQYLETLIAALEKSYVPTWSWVNWMLPSGHNLVAFSSGAGDGVYATYAGRGSSGQLVALVTDFQMIDSDGSDA